MLRDSPALSALLRRARRGRGFPENPPTTLGHAAGRGRGDQERKETEVAPQESCTRAQEATDDNRVGSEEDAGADGNQLGFNHAVHSPYPVTTCNGVQSVKGPYRYAVHLKLI